MSDPLHVGIKHPDSLTLEATGGDDLTLYARGRDGSRLVIIAHRDEWLRLFRGGPDPSPSDAAVSAYLRGEIDAEEMERRI